MALSTPLQMTAVFSMPGPGRRTHMEFELRILDRRKEVLTEVGNEREGAGHREQEARNELGPGCERGRQQAPIEGAHRLKAPLESALEEHERVARLRLGRALAVRRLMGEKEARHRVDQSTRQHVGPDQRERDRLRHGAEEIAADATEVEHRHEHDQDAKKRNGRWDHDLSRAVHDRAFDVLALLEMVIDVFDCHRRVVDENADREREAAERHHVDGFAHRRQRGDGRQNRQRNGDRDDEGRAPAAEKDENHQTGQRGRHNALEDDRIDG